MTGENKGVMGERTLHGHPPPPCFCVCAGMIGLTDECPGCAGMIGVRGEKQFTADSRRRRKRDGNTEITETGTQRAQRLGGVWKQIGAVEIVGAPTFINYYYR